MLADYHIHTCYSADSRAPIKDQLDAALSAGLTHICFADHVDFDGSHLPPADIAARNEEILRLAPMYPSLDISLGMEMGMEDSRANELAHLHAKDAHLDFIIGSVHMVDGVDAYYPEFFENRTQEQTYGCYIEKLSRTVKVSDFSVMGHYDFCTKYSPYSDRPMKYSMFPEMFDDIFRVLIERGRTLEINSSAWRNDPAWGLDVFSRFRELGGEFVTIGSDAHQPERVGARVKEALELAKAAGIRYIATFKNMKPIMHKI
ncbi:MAG: histidinol-phosphatase HisJ family protein [Clostridia bacterium]|nr:histidinol-phosphatase HisJ family protein [Clostridia bacterium]